jgi:hypothetical protein
MGICQKYRIDDMLVEINVISIKNPNRTTCWKIFDYLI